MKRRYWLGMAMAGCSMVLPAVSAQDRILPAVPGPSTGPSITHQKETDGRATDGAVSTEGVVTERVYDDYRPSFSERMGGIGSVLFRPISFGWFTDMAGANEPLMSGDLEDPVWIRGQMLFGWFPNANSPALLTTSLPQASRGILGNEGTSVLFGESIESQMRLGAKLTAGYWIEPSQSWGFEGSVYFLATEGTRYTAKSQGDPLLAAPYFDVLNNQQSSLVLANETLVDLDQQAANVQLGMISRFLGAELNTVHNVVRGTRGRLDWSWGYRYLRFDEEIFNTANVAQTPPQGQNFGNQFHFYDQFSVENEFQGFNLGVRSQWWWGCWSLDVTGKLAMGVIRNTVNVYGQTQIASPPQFQIFTNTGGIYALASNIGGETFMRFSVAPEIELGIGYQLSDQTRLTMSYDFLAITGVMRPGDQIDSRINPNILDGNSGNPANPVRLNQTTTLWIQSLSFGVEYRY